jgi:carbonic anhydrase
VIAETILGSLEYAVEVLQVPLILVLGHDQCGAIRATIDSTQGNLNAEGAFIHNLVSRITETVEQAQAHGIHGIDEITVLHVQDTINELIARSELIQSRIESGKLAVVGAKYQLSLGAVTPVQMLGNLN